MNRTPPLPAPWLALLPKLLAPRRHELIVLQPGGPLPGWHGTARVVRRCGSRLYALPRCRPGVDANGFESILAHASAGGACFVSGSLLAGHPGQALRRALLAENLLDAMLCLPPEARFPVPDSVWLLLVQPRRNTTLVGLIGPRPARAPQLGNARLPAALPEYGTIVAAHAAWRARRAHPCYLPGTAGTVQHELERFGL